ncbi:MAG: Lipoyl synthase [Chlamydiae bacterium]|nr:Lipoyl synthase [Chlamydiota bacterium]
MVKTDLFDTRPKVKKSRLNRLPVNPEKNDPQKAVGIGRFPSWLHRKLPKGSGLRQTEEIVHGNKLNTVCAEAKCPNLLECWSKKTATFLIMGNECTRSCGFCDIDFSRKPKPLDTDEPLRVAESAKQLNLKHVVITMVARDDLPDGGAQHLANVMIEIRRQISRTTLEVLTSDFMGNQEALDVIIDAQPEIFNHNIETVRELTPRVRHTVTYDRTLRVLRYFNTHKTCSSVLIKSGLMVGLGETHEQVQQTIRDLKNVGCDIITIGQYLQPNHHKLLVKKFVPPEEFKEYEDFGHSIGIKHMFCGPFSRSSYNADMVLNLENAVENDL